MGPVLGPLARSLMGLCFVISLRSRPDLAPISPRSRPDLARQAFLDTLLTDALVSSADGESNIPLETQACTAKLPPAALLEAVVRCAMAKLGTVNVLTTAGKTAALIEVHAC